MNAFYLIFTPLSFLCIRAETKAPGSDGSLPSDPGARFF